MSKVIADQAYPGWAIAVAAKYAGVNVSVEEDTNVKSKSVTGKGPILETQEGTIFTATAAARYVARDNKQLHGATPFEVAQVDQWCNFASQEIDIPANVWIFPILGLIQNNPAATPAAKADVQKVLDILNKHLETRTFLVGERITLADIVVATSLYRLYTKVLDANFRKAYVNTNRWFSTISNQPEFLAVLPATPLCTKMEVAPANAPKPAKEEKPKESKPAKESKPKEVKEEKPAEEDLEAEAEREAAAEAKKKNPLDLLPPSAFVMDEWKRQYSNNDTRTVAIPWFWEHYDPEGYSLWFADYKYNDELQQVFKTCNLMNGFIQRLDKVRKYAFGTLLIFGTEGSMSIKTAWLFRGKEIPADMLECDDSEHYVWTKVDTSNAEHKDRVNAFWAWDEFKEDKPFNQGKVFK